MSGRVLVKSLSGAVKDVAASAVPVLAAGGWQPLSEPEIAAHRAQQAKDRAAREAALMPASARAAAAPVTSTDVPPPAAEVGVDAPKKSGAKRRQDTTENEES